MTLEAVDSPVGEGPSDQQLVARVRRGDDRAFEVLYRRYHRRISAFVLGMVKDHGRAEDVTQEVFVSALRRMRQTERPIAFKPWIYEIAKNACIDAFRRSRRTEEVSYDAEEGLAPSDYGKLAESGPTPVEAVAAKEDLAHLQGAFGGLSDQHHEILVMRELEGLSYREIGDQLGMSRPAVESTLFRARKRLTEEYDELVSGARCLRIQGIIADAGAGAVGVRDSRRLARHIAHCQPCRRLAVGAGLEVAALAPPTRRARIAAKVAGWLPFPIPFLRRPFGGGGGHAATSAAQLAAAGGEPAAAGWAKMAVAAVTMVIAGIGAGVGEHAVQQSRHKASDSASGGAASRLVGHDRPLGPGPAGQTVAVRQNGGNAATGTSASRRSQSTSSRDRSTRPAKQGSGGGPNTPAAGGGSAPGGSGGGSAPAKSSSGGGGGGLPRTPRAPQLPSLPAVPAVPAAGGGGGNGSNPVQTVSDTTNQVTQTVNNTVQQTTNTVAPPVQDTVNQVGDTVNDTVDQVGDTAGQVVPGAGGLLP